MRNVIPQKLWIGNVHDARQLTHVLSLGIEAMVDLAGEELPPPVTRELVYLRIPLCDGDNPSALLTTAINAVTTLVVQETPTLVFCSAGMSRSPTIVAAALACARSRPIDECLAEVTAGEPHDISTTLLNCVKKTLGN